jgi:tol-pal system protein YbgF
MSLAQSKGTVLFLTFTALLFALLVLSGCSSAEATRSEQKAGPAMPSPMQKKIDSLETDNVTLKQKIVKFEQDNNTLNARLSDVEAKFKAELDKAAAAAKPPTPAPQPQPQPTATYEGAQKAFGEKRYDDAIQMFQALLDAGVPEDVADNCHYWIGESYFGKKNFQEALKQLGMVLQYKASEKKGDAYYMMGRSYEMLGDKAKAKDAYEKVVKDYPTNNNVKKAKERWGRL